MTSDDQSLDIRLNKYVAACGVCARRKADELIFNGRVKVNGEIQTNPGTRVSPRDVVEVDGKKISRARELLYVMLHKPPGYVTSANDPEGRPVTRDLLPQKFRDARLNNVGRLDYFSEGLLLMTNDGELANRLTHPRYHLEKIYEVTASSPFSEAMAVEARAGMTLPDGTSLAPMGAKIDPREPRRLTLRLRQGVNRQIRKMCDKWGITILKLIRVAQGNLRLGNLPPGKTRELTETEKSGLFKLAYADKRVKKIEHKRPDLGKARAAKKTE